MRAVVTSVGLSTEAAKAQGFQIIEMLAHCSITSADIESDPSLALQSSADEIADILASFITAKFDPNPVSFDGIAETGVRRVRTAIGRATEVPAALRRSVTRREFLAACLDFTVKEKVEHLIIGLGTKHGATTIISEVFRVVGSATRVKLNPMAFAAVQHHYRSDRLAEVLMFHNHPANFVNEALDYCPVASAADRRMLCAYVYNEEHLRKARGGGGRIRFYIGENGFVSEFTQPHWLDLLRSPQSPAQTTAE